MNKKLAPVFVILAGCFWGSIGIFVRRLNALGLGSMEIVESRSAITGGVLLLALLLFRRDLLRIRLRDLWCFAGGGLLSVVFFNYCYFRAIQLSSLSTAVILLYTSPLFVTLFSVLLFRERLTGRKVFCLLLAVGGCALASGLASGGGGVTLPVLLLGLGSGVGYALYSIFSRFALQKGYHPLTVTTYIFLFAGLGGAFLADVPKIFALAGQGLDKLGFLLLTALVTTILPFLLYTTGLSGMENSVAAVLVSIEPAVATVIGVLCFDELPDALGWLGVALVLTALALLNLPARRREKQTK